MHELSLVMSVLEIVEQYAAEHHFEKVNAITLSYGRLNCVSPQALEFAFNVQSRGGRAEGAKLIFNVLPAILHCFACGADMEIEVFDPRCPRCESPEVVLTAGTEELKLEEMDVD